MIFVLICVFAFFFFGSTFICLGRGTGSQATSRSLGTASRGTALHNFRLGSQNHLDVTRVGLVWSNTTVGTVGTATHDRSTLNLDVTDVQVVGLDTLKIGVALSIDEEVEQEATRLLWEADVVTGRLLVLLTDGGATSLLAEASERNGILVLDNVVQITLSLLQGHTLEHAGCFASVLEVNTEVRAASLDGPDEDQSRRSMTKRRREKNKVKKQYG
jgi:hypothetical protein